MLARLIASDPGFLALKRAGRGTLSFTLTLVLAWAVSRITGHPIMGMALGFPVSIFACVIVREQDARARLLTTLALVGAAALFFTVSALVTITWLNRALFVAIIFGAILGRRWGSRWTAAGFGSYVSFFFGAFLRPAAAALPWHMAGLLLALAAALFVQFVAIPHRPAAELDSALSALRRRLSLLVNAVARLAQAADRNAVRRELAQVQQAVAAARDRLDAADTGNLADPHAGFRLLHVQTAAERLVVQALAASGGVADAGAVLEELRDSLSRGRAPLHLPEAAGPVAQATGELRSAVARLSARAPVPQDADPDMPEADAPPEHGAAPGRLHHQTRLAIQAAAGTVLAIVGGELLSDRRWYWAVITVFVMFSNTQSRGDVLVKTLRRLAGTVAGVLAGIGLVWLVGDAHLLKLALLPLAIFLTFYFFTDRYDAMIFFLTVVLALLYSLTGRFTPSVLWLRLEETAIGAAAGLLVAALLLPHGTYDHARRQFGLLLDAAEAVVREAVTSLIEGDRRSLRAPVRAFDAASQSLRDAMEPLHLFPIRRHRAVREALDNNLQACGLWLHELALAAHDADSPASSEACLDLCRARDRFADRVGRMRDQLPDEAPAATEDQAGAVVDDCDSEAVRLIHRTESALTPISDAIARGRRGRDR